MLSSASNSSHRSSSKPEKEVGFFLGVEANDDDNRCCSSDEEDVFLKHQQQQQRVSEETERTFSSSRGRNSSDRVMSSAKMDEEQQQPVMRTTSLQLEPHPHQLLSVHRRTICKVNKEKSPVTARPIRMAANSCSTTDNSKHKKSMVEEMLEDFPEQNNDNEYNATFTDDVNMGEILCLDVGGDRYHVRRGCLTHLPNTRLGRLARCASLKDAVEFCDIAYDKKPPEYFFDRNGDNFSSILGKQQQQQQLGLHY